MFYVNTTWKHENEINEKQIQHLLASFKGTNPNVRKVHWLKVDNFTHGGLVIYKSEKGYIESKEIHKRLGKSQARKFQQL